MQAPATPPTLPPPTPPSMPAAQTGMMPNSLAGLSPAQMQEIQTAYQFQQLNPDLNLDQISQMTRDYLNQSTHTTATSIGATMDPTGLAAMAARGLINKTANVLGMNVGSYGQRASDFLSNIATPFSTQPTSGYGVAGRAAGLVPMTDAGVLFKGAGMIAPELANFGANALKGFPEASAAPDLMNTAPASNILTKVGDFLNPATSNSVTGTIGTGALNQGLTGLGLAAAGGGNLFTGAGVGAALGAGGEILPAILNTGPMNAIKKLKPIETVQNWLGNLTGNVVPNQIANTATGAVQELKDNVQKISNDAYQDVMQKADGLGIDASNPVNTWNTANDLAKNTSGLTDASYNGVKNDISRAQNLFKENQIIDPASGIVSTSPVSLQVLNNFKKEMFDKAYANSADPTAAGIYKQLGGAVKTDITDKLNGTPLQAENDANNQYFQDHVLPLREVPQDVGAAGLQNHILNENNSDFTKAITPEPSQSPIASAHNQMLQQFGQKYNTSPENLMKGFLMGSVDNDKNIVQPNATIGNYYKIANATDDSGDSKLYGHIFNGDAQGNPPLFSGEDQDAIGQLANDIGYFGKNLSAKDISYEAAALAGHSNSAGWIAKNSVGILSKYLPQASKYFNNPEVKSALREGGIPAAREALQNLMGKPSKSNLINSALKTNSLFRPVGALAAYGASQLAS